MIRIRHRSSPEGHDPIADKFVDRPFIFNDDFRDLPEVTIEAIRDLFRSHALCYSRESGNVREENGRLDLFSAKPQAFRVGQDVLNGRREIMGKGLLNLLPFFFTPDIGLYAKDGVGQKNRQRHREGGDPECESLEGKIRGCQIEGKTDNGHGGACTGFHRIWIRLPMRPIRRKIEKPRSPLAFVTNSPLSEGR